MEAAYYTETSAFDWAMDIYFDLDDGQTLTHSPPWDEHPYPEYPNVDVNNCSINPSAAGCIQDQDVPWADQVCHKNSYQYEGLKQCYFQSVSNSLFISPLTITFSPPESPSPSPPSTISSSPSDSKCDLDFEGHASSFDLQGSFSPSPISPINYSFGWDMQSPISGLDPMFPADPMNISSLLPNILRPTFAVLSSIVDISPETPKVDSERLSSLSPLAPITSLPSTELTDTGSPTRKPKRTNRSLLIHDPSPSPASTPLRSPSPLLLSSDSTLLQKSMRLTPKAGETPSYSRRIECQPAAIRIMNSSLKRSFEDSALADNSDDGDYADDSDEGTYEPIAHRHPARSKKLKEHRRKSKLKKRCSNCPETFTRSADRVRHLAAVHGINPKSKEEGQCRGCSKYLSRRDSRQRHERKCVDFFLSLSPNQVS